MKNQKGFTGILVAIIILLLIVAGIYFGYRYYLTQIIPQLSQIQNQRQITATASNQSAKNLKDCGQTDFNPFTEGISNTVSVDIANDKVLTCLGNNIADGCTGAKGTFNGTFLGSNFQLVETISKGSSGCHVQIDVLNSISECDVDIAKFANAATDFGGGFAQITNSPGKLPFALISAVPSGYHLAAMESQVGFANCKTVPK